MTAEQGYYNHCRPFSQLFFRPFPLNCYELLRFSGRSHSRQHFLPGLFQRRDHPVGPAVEFRVFPLKLGVS